MNLIRNRSKALGFLLTAAGASGQSFNDNVSSRLQIHVPHNLYRDNGYDHREALFGIPPYGGSIAQNIYYADSDLCDATVNTRGGYPARMNDESGQPAPWPSPFILMVDRGGCSFVRKVRNAQHAGAAAVIIADNLCLCSDLACVNSTEDAICQAFEPVMSDDGSGGDIFIPSFLMLKLDADLIKDEVKKSRMVQVEMSWALPAPDDRVEYDLWSAPSETKFTWEFQKQWKPVAKALGKRAYFTPYQYVFDGVRSNCLGALGVNMCYNLCTNNGRYCALDPDGDLEKGASGADVVRESLRRICIWNNYGQADGVGEKYWDYVIEFSNRCKDPFFNDNLCVNEAMKKAKVDRKTIENCMKDSGGTEGDNENAFLRLELDAQSRRGIVIIPGTFVNNVAIRGALTPTNLFSAICAGYLAGTAPSICTRCSGCSDVPGCVDKGSCSDSSKGSGISGGVSKRTFGLTLLAVCSVFVAVGYLQWKRTRDEMREQVRGILAEYMPLEDQGDDDISPMDFARKGARMNLMS